MLAEYCHSSWNLLNMCFWDSVEFDLNFQKLSPSANPFLVSSDITLASL